MDAQNKTIIGYVKKFWHFLLLRSAFLARAAVRSVSSLLLHVFHSSQHPPYNLQCSSFSIPQYFLQRLAAAHVRVGDIYLDRGLAYINVYWKC